jgi:hypothetical protein
MSINYNDAMDLFKSILDGHSTQYNGLHPFQQERARQYEEAVQHACDHLELAEVYAGRRWLSQACIDAVMRSDEWLSRNWSERPKRYYMFDRVELGQRPFPDLVTVPSFETTRTLLVLVSYKEVNDKGYGDLGTADYYSVGLYDSAMQAEEAGLNLSRAVKFFLKVLPDLTSNQVNAEVQAGRWSDKPDF